MERENHFTSRMLTCAGALMAASLTGSGVGILVLCRTHRHQLQNLAIIALVYALGVGFGILYGWIF